MARAPIFRWLHFLIYLFFFFLLFLALSENRAEYDTWGYLVFGRAFWKGPGFLTADIFSYLPTKSFWIFHEWLSGVVLYAVSGAFGLHALQIWKILIGLCMGGIALYNARRRGASTTAAMFFILTGFWMLYPFLLPFKARLFSWFFLVCFVTVLERVSQTGRFALLYWLPLFMLCWTNLHGSFPFGLVVLAVYTGAFILRKKASIHLAVAWALCGAATFVNPYGWDLWAAVFHHTANPEMNLFEWTGLLETIKNQDNYEYSILHLIMAGFSLLLLAKNRFQDLPATLMLFLTASMSILHVRFIQLFALCFLLYTPSLFTHFREGSSAIRFGKFKTSTLAAAPFVLIFFLFLFLNSSRSLLRLTHPGIFGSPFQVRLASCETLAPDDSGYPVDALRFLLESGFSGNLLAYGDWGSFCLFFLYPQVRVAMDSRYETAFPPAVLSEYFRFIYAKKDPSDFLKNYPHDLLLLPAHTRIHGILSQSRHWKEVYGDDCAVLFAPSSP